MSEQAPETPPADPQGDQGAPPADPTTQQPQGGNQPAGEQQPQGDEALGDAGKKALDAMKQERNSARDELKQIRDEFESFKAQAEGRQQEHEAAQREQQIKDQALAEANDRILKAEVRAAGASKLSDPSDALRFIDTSEFEVGDDGSVDAQAINSAIDSLIENKPYLAAQGKRFQGTADGGARNEAAAKPRQYSREDLAAMNPEQINEARSAGHLDDLLSGKS